MANYSKRCTLVALLVAACMLPMGLGALGCDQEMCDNVSSMEAAQGFAMLQMKAVPAAPSPANLGPETLQSAHRAASWQCVSEHLKEMHLASVRRYAKLLAIGGSAPSAVRAKKRKLKAAKVVGVAAGDYHTILLEQDGAVYTVGYNGVGQLGDGTTTDKSKPVQIMTGVKDVAAGASHTILLKQDGAVFAVGRNTYGQLGDGTTSPQRKSTPVQIMTGVKDMAAGRYHTILLKQDGAVFAVGRNEYGQLGDGTTTSKSTPVQIMTGVKNMAAGGGHTILLKQDSAVYTVGYNVFGQLGDGTKIDKSTPVLIIAGVSTVTTTTKTTTSTTIVSTTKTTSTATTTTTTTSSMVATITTVTTSMVEAATTTSLPTTATTTSYIKTVTAKSTPSIATTQAPTTPLPSEAPATHPLSEAPTSDPPLEDDEPTLDADGFKETTSLCCPVKMEVFFTRLLNSMGQKVCTKPHVQGLMHWFTCVPDMDFQYMLDIIENGNPCKYWGPGSDSCPDLSAKCAGIWCR